METSTINLDSIDRALLIALQENARLSNAELARRVELSPSGLQKRLTRLQTNGLIVGFTTILNRAALGYELQCIVCITLSRDSKSDYEESKAKLIAFPEVQEALQLTGDADLLIKIIVKDVAHLDQFLTNKLPQVKAIEHSRTSIVLEELKSTTKIPISAE